MWHLFLGYDLETASYIEDAGCPPLHAAWLGRVGSVRLTFSFRW